MKHLEDSGDKKKALSRSKSLASEVIHLRNLEEERSLLGNRDKNLRFLQKRFGVMIVSRNGVIRVEGEEWATKKVAVVLKGFLADIRRRRGRDVVDLEEFVLREGLEEGGEPLSAGDKKNKTSFPLIVDTCVSPRSKGQLNYVKTMDENHIIFSIGPAGTGKTFLAVAKAISYLKRGEIRRLVLVRPAVEAGESLGFLPGDFKEKVNPYLKPLYDALNYILEYTLVQRYLERGIIEIVPLAYMRGRTLEDAFIILDEAQNTTPKQMLMFLTRMGVNSKIVVTGDITQIDLPRDRSSGLIHAMKILKGIEGIGFVALSREDIIRHRLVQDIVDAYSGNDLSSEGVAKEGER